MKEKVQFRFNPRSISYDEFIQDKSIKVIAFEYLIPRPIFSPVKRLSKFYLFHENEKPIKVGYKYNISNFLFGWIGLPLGPAYMISSFLKNFKGIDVSIDFRANINPDDYSNKLLNYKKTEEIFLKPDKSTCNGIIKALKKFEKNERHLNSIPIAGLKIDDTEKAYYIGISNKDITSNELILKYLYKYFYKHTKFIFIDINEDNSLSKKLHEQGCQLQLK